MSNFGDVRYLYKGKAVTTPTIDTMIIKRKPGGVCGTGICIFGIMAASGVGFAVSQINKDNTMATADEIDRMDAAAKEKYDKANAKLTAAYMSATNNVSKTNELLITQETLGEQHVRSMRDLVEMQQRRKIESSIKPALIIIASILSLIVLVK